MAIGLAILTCAALAIAIYFFVTDGPSSGAVVLPFVALFAIPLVIGTDGYLRPRKSGSAPLRNRTDENGVSVLEIPYSKIQYGGFVAVGIVLASFVTPFLVGAITNLPDSLGGLIITAAVMLIPLSLLALMLTGKFTLGRIRLSENGIHQRGWTLESTLSWENTLVVMAAEMDGAFIYVRPHDESQWKRRQISKIWRQDKLPPADLNLPGIHIPAKNLAADPALVYWLLRFYHLHPEARSELGTQAALSRATTASFD